MLYYLGVEGEVAWLPSILRHDGRMLLSCLNRMINMNNDSITEIILNCDYQKNTCN